MAKCKLAITESQVVSLWQKRMQTDRRLIDTLGRPIQVIYPGRSSDTRGGDFRDAVVKTGSISLNGNIEIHTLNSNWLTHGHHKDPLYNNVILHVAFQSDREVPTVLQNGSVIPTVILNQLKSVRFPSALPCAKFFNKTTAASFCSILENYGLERLESKARKFQSEMLLYSADQVLYTGLLEALGYAKNQQPFCQLAEAVPLDSLNTLLQRLAGCPDRINRLESYLLGCAGLLPSQRGKADSEDSVIAGYESFWKRMRGKAPTSKIAWELYKVRPTNYPLRRLAALARLAERFCLSGWQAALLSPLIFASPEKIPGLLINNIRVEDDGYWSNHYDFACPTPQTTALIGKQRSAEIVINVILPYALAWCRSRQLPFESSLKNIYRSFPAMPGNSIERHMREQTGFSREVTLTACGQQGLLQIYKSLCIRGECSSCQLGDGA